MPQDVAPLTFKPSRLQGLSERLLASHYENNYGGALRRLNANERRLGDLDWSPAPVFDINGLKREEVIAAGSVILAACPCSRSTCTSTRITSTSAPAPASTWTR